ILTTCQILQKPTSTFPCSCKYCIKDEVTNRLFRQILADEEDHHDVFSIRLEEIWQIVEKVVFPQAGQKHPDARRAKS
ncbi:MAG: hypothetical protein NTZ51_05145, partial [Proteobacteria bacterium]|nr:hypothetical protein [Pseudomonadota bacterium]